MTKLRFNKILIGISIIFMLIAIVDKKSIASEIKINTGNVPKIIVRQGDTIIKSGNYASGDVTIEINGVDVDESEVIYEYSYNNKDWIEYEGVLAYTKETTDTRIYARAYDKKTGSSLSEIGEHILKLDKTNPLITVESINATRSGDGIINKYSEITISLKVIDNISGINSKDFTLDDIEILSTYNGEEKEIIDINKKLIEDSNNINLEKGTYKYTLILKDIKENGRLSLRIKEKSIYDKANRYNLQKTINTELVLDNKGPEVGIIITQADEYGKVYDPTVKLELKATDINTIKSYEWQVSNDKENWETFKKEETISEISEVIYNSTSDGIHYFKVIVTDIINNVSTSEITSVNIISNMNRKPTITLETDQISDSKVNIKAIIKSTAPISKIVVNASTIDSSTWKTEKINNEITTVVTCEVRENGVYEWKITDETGNSATERININKIENLGAIITYKILNVTQYAPAKIEFTANQEIKINKVIKPNGEEITDIQFNTLDYTNKVIATIESDMDIELEIGTIFVFENKSFIETYVELSENVETKLIYMRTTSEITKLFENIFNLEKAKSLVNQMLSKTKLIAGKVISYYGISNLAMTASVSDNLELKAMDYLSEEIRAGEVLKLNKYGDIEKLKATVKRNTDGNNLSYINRNITGIKTFGDILNWTGNTIKNTFRITIKSK